MTFDITKIPGIMRSKTWLNAARLMDSWFSRPSGVAPAYGPPDTATIRMDTWVLRFPRARQVYDQLIRERVWAGSVAPAPGGARFQVTITEVGIYIRDSYDFNGDQDLGYWDDTDNSVSMINPLSGTKVTNADFRAWRAPNGRGGDFLVFSDVKRTTLRPPDSFLV